MSLLRRADRNREADDLEDVSSETWDILLTRYIYNGK